MEYILKICGIKSSCNTNYTIEHVKALAGLLISDFYSTENDITTMELISGLTFSILGDFDAPLDEDSTIQEDIKKTNRNIKKLQAYFRKTGGTND